VGLRVVSEKKNWFGKYVSSNKKMAKNGRKDKKSNFSRPNFSPR
jgi:hypothetical protein